MAKKDLLHYTAHCSTVFFSVKKFKTKNHSSQNILIKANLDISRQFDKNLKIRSFNCFTLWNKCFNCFTLWKKTIVSQCEINECFQKFLSFFSINFCQIHNVHTMKQSFMFNSALNSQWNPLFSIEISFFDPHSLKNLITRFACYYSLRSYPQLASLVIRFLSLWGSKNEISLSTKWIPLFVANTVKQKPLLASLVLSKSERREA